MFLDEVSSNYCLSYLGTYILMLVIKEPCLTRDLAACNVRLKFCMHYNLGLPRNKTAGVGCLVSYILSIYIYNILFLIFSRL